MLLQLEANKKQKSINKNLKQCCIKMKSLKKSDNQEPRNQHLATT